MTTKWSVIKNNRMIVSSLQPGDRCHWRQLDLLIVYRYLNEVCYIIFDHETPSPYVNHDRWDNVQRNWSGTWSRDATH